MKYEVRDLDEARGADSTECERLSQRLYALAAEWETAIERQSELRRQFVARDSVAEDLEREVRMDELLELTLRVEELRRALHWTDLRRTRLLQRLKS